MNKFCHLSRPLSSFQRLPALGLDVSLSEAFRKIEVGNTGKAAHLRDRIANEIGVRSRKGFSLIRDHEESLHHQHVSLDTSLSQLYPSIVIPYFCTSP